MDCLVKGETMKHIRIAVTSRSGDGLKIFHFKSVPTYSTIKHIVDASNLLDAVCTMAFNLNAKIIKNQKDFNDFIKQFN